MKKIKNYLLAFIIPFIICLTFFYLKNVLQHIENIYVSDLRLQHIVFLTYLKNVLLGKASLLYSFSAGIGSSMLSTIIFYCVSPINILLLLIKDIRYAILFIYIVKVCLASLTMYIFLSKKYNSNTLTPIVFSTCYALSSFAISYYFCIFWLDCLYLAPLVVLGIEELFNKEKISLIYIFSLALCIICNIQMGFGLCVFSVIYYFYSYNTRYELKKDLKKLKNLSIIFIVSSLCAGAISSGALLGFMSEYNNISLSRKIAVGTSAATTNILFVLKNLFTVGNLKVDYYNNFEPYVYCGLIVTFFSILYLFDKKINKKKRIHALIVILVFIISFSIKSLNLFWHLSEPVLLNYRYSIYLSLFLTMIAFESYITKKSIEKKDIIILGISTFVGVFLITIYKEETYIGYSFIFLLLMLIMIILAKNKHKIFEYILLILVIVEVTANSYLSLYTAKDIPYESYTTYKSIIELSNKKKIEDEYRVMYNYSSTDLCNDTLLLNKNSSLRYFSSVINGKVSNFFLNNLSFVGNNNYRVSAFDSPLLISLMGNKYFYLTGELTNSVYKKLDTYTITNYDYFTLKNKKQNIYLYENPYSLSIGYMIEKDTTYNKKMDNVTYQNNIIKSFSGIDKDILIRLDYEEVKDEEQCKESSYPSCEVYHLKNNTNNPNYYVYASFNEYNTNANATSYIDTNRPILFVTPNNNMFLKIDYAGDLKKETFNVNTYDEEALITSLKKLQENMLTNVNFNKNTLNGTINSKKNGTLFLSIPYSKNFNIYIDNKKTNYYGLLDNTFIGLNIKEGNHKIKLVYKDNRIYLYTTLTIISVIITIALNIFINKKIDFKQKEEQIKQKELEEKKKEQQKRKKELEQKKKETVKNKKNRNKKRK